MEIEWNDEGWDEVARLAIDKVAVPRCEKIAAVSNAELPGSSNEPGYIVGVEGGKPLQKHDYRSTVITKTNEAMLDNAKYNTLIKNLHVGEDGAE